ncbi:MAG TPA: YbaN family protein [Acidimicrobiales bacterium]
MGRARRLGWFLLGWAAVALGGIGIVVPGLPTTGFFVLAAGCFARSSPRFEQWVLDLPKVGPLVRAYRAGLGMPKRAKVTAVTMIVLACSLSALTVASPVVSPLILVAGAIGVWYLTARVPTATGVPGTGGVPVAPGETPTSAR